MAATSGGLNATELAAAAAELRTEVCGLVVADVARLRDRDDLLLFLAGGDGSGRRRGLHLVPGAQRGRITLTARRFPRAQLATGPRIDQLRSELVGCRLADVIVAAGERRATLDLVGDDRRWSLVVELFGSRGLWCLVDADRRVRTLSRLLDAGAHGPRPGDDYRPPPPPPPRPAASRFPEPVLASIDAHYTAADLAEEQQRLRQQCDQALQRAERQARARLDGVRAQLDGAAEAGGLRRRADLLLAYGFAAPPGATSIAVPDPAGGESPLEIALDPRTPVAKQAEALYSRARRLEDAAAAAAERRARAAGDLADWAALRARLAAAADPEALAAVEAELVRRGALRRPRPAPAPVRTSPLAEFRRFRSVEGLDILCGKTNAQNDRLTLRIARGNDLWLHVGRGYAGSHVVVRVAKGKTASLETMIDAATIAVHFSKARGSDRAEVLYTQAKHVRKPKGAAAGAVVPHHTKTLLVARDEARLRRLLATAVDQ